ncbi:restriction endonuclease subunit S [Hydrogenophaga sp. MI9]|uniref:restriction endonuclease subunit S n=1 Tax=Hydrogenophaga sp. MI9 TaxID=3453719 RepID=UPI003EEF4B3A
MSAVMEAREPSARYISALQPPLVQQFDLLATAPGGVARLRELILTQAVQGKLVPQDQQDDPASELLKKIRAEKDRLIAEGKIKREKPPVEIAEKEPPFALPRGWEWVQLGEIGLVGSSSRVHQSDWKECGVPFYRAREIVKLSKDGYVSNELFISEELFASLTLSGWVPEENDIMITGVGTIGIPYVVRPSDRFYFKDASVLIFKNYGHLNAQWLTWLMRSPLWIDGIHEHSMGTTVDTLTISRANIALLPLPPANEQTRIVTRVEELMRLCDALETKGQLEAAQHAQLVQTLLGALTASTSPEELADNWQRVATHFDLLLDRPEAIDALEQTILQLAVRGLLVPQNPKDEPAGELLKKIRAEKDRLIADGKNKRDKPMEPVAIENVPFALPKGWSWVRFDELIHPLKPIAYGVLVPGPDVEEGVPFVRIADLSIDNPAPMPEKSIGRDIDSQFQRTRLEGGEILMGVVGSIGKLGVAPPTWAGANIARAICRIVPADSGLREFVLFLLQTEFMQQSFVGDTRTLAQPTLNVGLIRQAITPVPPPAEQARIVARVGLLRRHCAELRQRITASQTTQAHLAEALIDEVT